MIGGFEYRHRHIQPAAHLRGLMRNIEVDLAIHTTPGIDPFNDG
jgi:hypothetical protein